MTEPTIVVSEPTVQTHFKCNYHKRRNYISDVIVSLLSIFIMIVWLMGIVIAKGFWSTLFSMFFPPWAFYLVVERSMIILLGPPWV